MTWLRLATWWKGLTFENRVALTGTIVWPLLVLPISGAISSWHISHKHTNSILRQAIFLGSDLYVISDAAGQLQQLRAHDKHVTLDSTSVTKVKRFEVSATNRYNFIVRDALGDVKNVDPLVLNDELDVTESARGFFHDVADIIDSELSDPSVMNALNIGYNLEACRNSIEKYNNSDKGPDATTKLNDEVKIDAVQANRSLEKLGRPERVVFADLGVGTISNACLAVSQSVLSAWDDKSVGQNYGF